VTVTVDVLVMVLRFIIVIGVLILVHELGHFAVARLTGVGVERFSIGFGPVLLRWRGKETEYCLSLIPMGGYVKMMARRTPSRAARRCPTIRPRRSRSSRSGRASSSSLPARA